MNGYWRLYARIFNKGEINRMNRGERAITITILPIMFWLAMSVSMKVEWPLIVIGSLILILIGIVLSKD